MSDYSNNINGEIRAVWAGKIKPECSASEFDLLYHIFAPVFSKSGNGDSRQWAIFARIQGDLLFLLCYSIGDNLSEQELIRRRSLVVRVVMGFFSDMNKRLHIVPENVVLEANVMPPLDNAKEGLFAGMDPEQIKDPESRAAYKKAIADNTLLSRNSLEQRSAQDQNQFHWEAARKFLIRVYGMRPTDFYELHDYLKLGLVSDEESRTIMEAASKAAKEELPIGLRQRPKQ
jgi:hypothetical protein